MRIDKYLSSCGVCTRSEASKAVRRGDVTVNGAAVKKADAQIDTTDRVTFCGRLVEWRRFTYIMLNKPEGVISATSDGGRDDRTALDLLPEQYARLGFFPCGRLDRGTTGLLLITNDGETAHRLLSPKNHVAKTYAFTCEKALSEGDLQSLRDGVRIGEGAPTAPAEIFASPGGCSGEITITEGKFHQIKRMFFAVGNEITSLERVSFGGVSLDRSLERGQWRELTENEQKTLLEAAGK